MAHRGAPKRLREGGPGAPTFPHLANGTVSYGWQATRRFRPERTVPRSAKVRRARQPSLTLANGTVSYGWQAMRRFRPERTVARSAKVGRARHILRVRLTND
jgi:hypothetical protein